MSPADLSALQDILLPAIREIVIESIREERERAEKDLAAGIEATVEKICTCPVSRERKPAIPRILDMMEDAGGGSIVQGISVVRENTAWTSRVRRRAEENKGAIVATILTTIATAVTGLVLGLIGWGGK